MKIGKVGNIKSIRRRRIMIVILIIPLAVVVGIIKAAIGAHEGITEIINDAQNIWIDKP